MKNNEAIFLSNNFTGIIEAHFNEESKINLSDKAYYALRKSVRIIAPIVKENQSLIEDCQAVFKKKEKVDEEKLSDPKYLTEVNEKLVKFRAIPENISAETDYNKETFNLELFKITGDDLDACILPIGLFNLLDEYLTEDKT
jgi:hypothetical protein